MDEPVSVAIIGLGARGKDTYAPYAKLHPDRMKITAVADIDADKVKRVANDYNLKEENCFLSADELLKAPKLADVIFICTQDRQHFPHVMAALERGYDILLEKPASNNAEECIEIAKAAKRFGRKVTVCHVLRYTVFFQKIKELIDSGRIGEVVTIQHIENVCWWHQAHSFVRGNWRSSEETSPMILAKSCHDMDILRWLIGRECKRISSYGSLYHFRKENAPAGAAKRCLEGCKAKDKCPYDAEKIYIQSPFGVNGNRTWPTTVLALDVSLESVTEALLKGPYGRCVYYCDNDVVDHQVVSMEFEGGVTASFTMTAFTSEGGREIKVMGTHGDIVADMNSNTITVTSFGDKHEIINLNKIENDLNGHGGGDNRMLDDFTELITTGNAKNAALTDINVSIESHIMALAAEKSRTEHGRSVELKEIYDNPKD